MPYVMKGADGQITAVSAIAVDAVGWEFIEGNSEDYVEFLQTALAQHDPFRESDIHLARVLEDLISLLIKRNIIQFTDFPSAAQRRLTERQMLRDQGYQGLDILDESQGPLI
jgi:hypothetical protein